LSVRAWRRIADHGISSGRSSSHRSSRTLTGFGVRNPSTVELTRHFKAVASRSWTGSWGFRCADLGRSAVGAGVYLVEVVFNSSIASCLRASINQPCRKCSICTLWSKLGGRWTGYFVDKLPTWPLPRWSVATTISNVISLIEEALKVICVSRTRRGLVSSGTCERHDF
jgi:hypothetical protein